LYRQTNLFQKKLNRSFAFFKKRQKVYFFSVFLLNHETNTGAKAGKFYVVDDTEPVQWAARDSSGPFIFAALCSTSELK
jgi:hypothetical protein